ncbi:MAG: hypothetical protein KME42_14180 [Tildeniella nuda ZEHNDER 1965/U140]|jgi:hypothetical protein|nr:hypothetical protein [Tildeniella nuda ZEHNDER 1965/U140]
MASREFAYDASSGRYRATSGAGKGQYISSKAITALTESYIDQSKEKARSLTSDLLAGNLRVGEWEKAIALELKSAHINAFTLGRGGQARLETAKERSYGLIGAELKKEYGYLRGFSKDILAGYLSELQIQNRVSMYLDALHGSFELGRLEAHKADGFIRERRIRDSRESCDDCVGYAAQGWVDIGSLPNPGDKSSCRSMCRCSKQFDKGDSGQDSLLARSWGWTGAAISRPLSMMALSKS